MEKNNFNFHFQKIVKKNKYKVAITDLKNKKYTYDYLNKKSDHVSSFLINNIKKGGVILVQAKKNIDTFLSIIACLKSGYPYIMLDDNLPKRRVDQIIQSSSSKIYLTSDLNKNMSVKNFLIRKIKKYDLINDLNIYYGKVKENNIAYIMYTSGSTGEPKGAMIDHKSLLSFSKETKINFKIKKNDVFTQLNPLYFDNSVFDIFASLLNGNKLVLIEKLNIGDPKKLIQRIFNNKCTVWFSTPSLLIYLINISQISKKKFKFLKKIIFGGEAFPKEKLQILFNILKNKEYYNVYGPTEGTCICSSHLIKEKDLYDVSSMYVSLGKIWKSFKYKIVNKSHKNDKHNHGELVLMGKSIAHGYIGKKNLTKKQFYFTKKYRAYKTGDIVYENYRNKKIFFVGRKDSQIKHMGYRIELNEIEVVINKIPEVKEVFIFYVKKSLGSIVAIISTNDNKLSREKINLYILKHLPKYFLPNYIFFCKDLIKNANDKIDKYKLKKIYEEKITS